jgi:hypothetical protein
MQTGITGEPTSPLRAGPPPELTYRLGVADLVAYWVYLCYHARHLLPRAVVIQLRWPAPVLHFCLGAGAMLTVALLDTTLPGPRPFKVAAALLLTVLGSAVLADLVFSHRPDRLLRRGWATAPYRWLARRSLYGLARRQAEIGVLNTAATWHFAMTAEGFTLTTEREEVGVGIVYVAGKRIQGPWAAVEHVGGTESHLFLTARDGTAFIVPRGELPGDAFHDVVVTATRYHRAAVEGGPPPTGVTLRVEAVQGGPRASEGVLRAEDRVASAPPGLTAPR